MLLWIYKECYAATPCPSIITPLLEEFGDVFSQEMPAGSTPLRDIEYQIDLGARKPLPNRPTCKAYPTEAKEIERQVEELLNKGYVRGSLSPCTVPVLLVPKKNGESQMCVDCRAINNIGTKYRT